MVFASLTAPVYRCPGEDYEITHSVHLARLDAHYPKCRTCVHNANDNRDAVIAPACAPRDASDAVSSSQLFQTDGVRGRYLNELSRQVAARLAGAFASDLCDRLIAARAGDDEPIVFGKSPAASTDDPQEAVRVLSGGRPGPTVVLAHDERPHAPDLMLGAAGALRRMGCQVAEIGLATRPAFAFAVQHLRAAGGVHVTGSGCDPAWAGLDFVLSEARPCSKCGDLDRVEQRYRDGYSRPTRRPGAQQSLRLNDVYEATLTRHFHAIRPFKIVLSCSCRILHGTLDRLFRRLACRLIKLETPVRARNLNAADDPDVVRVAAAVRQHTAHLGILIDDDAQACLLFDERGASIDGKAILALFGREERLRNAGGKAVIETSESTLATMFDLVRNADVACGGGVSGRFWFREVYPVCDAVVTLIKLLHILSQSDKPFSEVTT